MGCFRGLLVKPPPPPPSGPGLPHIMSTSEALHHPTGSHHRNLALSCCGGLVGVSGWRGAGGSAAGQLVALWGGLAGGVGWGWALGGQWVLEQRDSFPLPMFVILCSLGHVT